MPLFKFHFRTTVAEGLISQIKLKCAKGYVFFAFSIQSLDYEVKAKVTATAGCHSRAPQERGLRSRNISRFKMRADP